MKEAVVVAAIDGVVVLTTRDSSTGGTVNVVDPLTPPEVAEIIAVPWVFAVTSPVVLTVATAVSDDAHVALFVRSWVLLFE